MLTLLSLFLLAAVLLAGAIGMGLLALPTLYLALQAIGAALVVLLVFGVPLVLILWLSEISIWFGIVSILALLATSYIWHKKRQLKAQSA